MRYLFILSLASVIACSSGTNSTGKAKNFYEEDGSEEEVEIIEYNNPPAEGFDQEGSDMIAMLFADKIMHAMGGREAWDNTRYISWNFFGYRTHIWDKHTGDVRIEIPEDSLIILMNINTKEGKVQMAGKEITESIDTYMDKGYAAWVNDSYWLFMPFKLKDTGVTLRYLGEDTTLTGVRSDKLALNFKNVGLTPDNIYLIWVDIQSKLIMQWSYYADSSAPQPQTHPWTDYKQYGNILLSSGRGQYEFTDIKVHQTVPDGTFTNFDPVML